MTTLRYLQLTLLTFFTVKLISADNAPKIALHEIQQFDTLTTDGSECLIADPGSLAHGGLIFTFWNTLGLLLSCPGQDWTAPKCIGVTMGLDWREPGRHSICMWPHALFPPWLLHSYTTVSWFIPTIHQNCLFLSICIVGFIRIIHILVKTVWHNMSINQRLFAYWRNTVATQWSSMFWGPVIRYALIYCPEINRFRSSGSYAWFT